MDKLGRAKWARTRLGPLALKPERIYIDNETDLCIMTLNSEEWKLLDMSTIQLQDILPLKPKMEVGVWGFPDVQSPQHEEVNVTSIERGYFVLNRPLEGGYSGGPVFSADEQLLGVVVRSTEKQSMCIPLEMIKEAISRFNENSVVYEETVLNET